MPLKNSKKAVKTGGNTASDDDYYNECCKELFLHQKPDGPGAPDATYQAQACNVLLRLIKTDDVLKTFANDYSSATDDQRSYMVAKAIEKFYDNDHYQQLAFAGGKKPRNAKATKTKTTKTTNTTKPSRTTRTTRTTKK